MIEECSKLYAADPMRWEYIFVEAKKAAIAKYHHKNANSSLTPIDRIDMPVADVSAPVSDDDASPNVLSPRFVEKKDSIMEDIFPYSREICEIINQVRQSPALFIPALERHLDSFIDDYVYRDKTGENSVNIRTNEGKVGVKETIAFLKRAVSVSPLEPSILLESSAVDHVYDLWTSGLTGHDVSIQYHIFCISNPFCSSLIPSYSLPAMKVLYEYVCLRWIIRVDRTSQIQTLFHSIYHIILQPAQIISCNVMTGQRWLLPWRSH